MTDLNGSLLKKLIAIQTVSNFRKAGTLNPATSRRLFSAYMDNDPSKLLSIYENVEIISKSFGSPFERPDQNVNGLINFAVTENNIPVGINPNEVHFLGVGQSGSGKSVLLKIIFSQALLLNRFHNAVQNLAERIICWLFVKAQDMRSLLNFNTNILVVSFNEIKLRGIALLCG